jgi:hypothetical protein
MNLITGFKIKFIFHLIIDFVKMVSCNQIGALKE